MTTFIDTENLKFNYNLIRIAGASPDSYRDKLFLKADSPEVKMLCILGNFEKDDSYEAVKAIISEVQAFAKSDFAESRYLESR